MPYIKKECVDKILDQVDIVKVIGSFVELKKAGGNFTGLSPFVEENTPSFTVSKVKQIWKDFSSGKGGNSAVSFLMEYKGWEYPKCIEYLANTYSIEIEYDDSKQAKAYTEKLMKQQELRPILKATIKKYKEDLLKSPKDSKQYIEVFTTRKYTDEIVETYQIGYAAGSQILYKILLEKGLVNDAKKISLLNDNNKDFYYNRVVYTLFDSHGNPVSLAGRDLNYPTKLKWLNGKENELYNKSSIWYGLHIAKPEIVKSQRAYIVEGYNDVIAFQTNGLLNTVGSCGTSISISQIKALKKYTDTVILCMDSDKAGRASIEKYIPIFLENGFRVHVMDMPECDPDEFVREFEKEIKESDLQTVIKNKTTVTDGFKLLLDRLKDKDEIDRATEAQKLCNIISKISDKIFLQIYIGWLQKESKIGKKALEAWVKEASDEVEKTHFDKNTISFNDYVLPNDVELTEELEKIIEKYQLFQAKNRIYIQIPSNDPPYYFRSVSNFSIEIIQHMHDEKFPMKLIRIENILKQSRVFDIPSKDILTPLTFETAVTNQGNFRYDGGRRELNTLKAYLFDMMGSGRKLDVLGWQKEGFWVFNNKVIVPGKPEIKIDENGVFKHYQVSYYIPSANQIYKDNAYKYNPQKRFKHVEGKVSFTNYVSMMMDVHREHTISAILYTISTIFHDYIAGVNKNFPILFLFGPASTGKDQLMDCCQSFYGDPQVATNLEGGNSTATANIRELAQFQNGLMQWSEYSRGDSKLDGTIKSLWDLRGKKTGTLESRIATDTVPILSGVTLTGNDYPDAEAVITRLIWNDMDKNTFNDDEIKKYEKLEDITKKGLGHLTEEILHLRSHVEENFKKKFRHMKELFSERIPDGKSRMIGNIAVMGAMYSIISEHIDFPFTFNKMVAHFQKLTENQLRRLTSASIVTRWWDCFLAAMRGQLLDQIHNGRDFKLEQNTLYFQFTNCYNKIQRQWYSQYKEVAPAKSVLMDSIKKDGCYMKSESSVRYGAGMKNTSAVVVDISRMPENYGDLLQSEIEYQIINNNIPSIPTDTSENKSSTKNTSKDEEFPF